jgi:hypothetical protein
LQMYWLMYNNQQPNKCIQMKVKGKQTEPV